MLPPGVLVHLSTDSSGIGDGKEKSGNQRAEDDTVDSGFFVWVGAGVGISPQTRSFHSGGDLRSRSASELLPTAEEVAFTQASIPMLARSRLLAYLLVVSCGGGGGRQRIFSHCSLIGRGSSPVSYAKAGTLSVMIMLRKKTIIQEYLQELSNMSYRQQK
jgi:hypothetical protein